MRQRDAACELSCFRVSRSVRASTRQSQQGRWARLGLAGRGKDAYIYHLLGGALGQEVAVPEVVDFDILDVVAVVDVHLAVEVGSRGISGGVRAGGLGRGRLDGRDIDMLDALFRLDLGIDPSGSSSWDEKLVSTERANVPGEKNAPAAAAASTVEVRLFSEPLPSPSRGKGLRSRPASDLRPGGERDRRSKRERRGSGSVWSNRDRFTVRRSASSMVHDGSNADVDVPVRRKGKRAAL